MTEEKDANPLSEELKEMFGTGDDMSDDVNNITTSEPTSKVLGVGYDLDSDELFVKIGDKGQRVVKTKREMLALIAEVYDPLGVVCLYGLKGRIFFQQVNDRKIGWNNPVPKDILKPFNKWKESLAHLKAVRIPRWTAKLGMEGAMTELLVCSNASKCGYGIVC